MEELDLMAKESSEIYKKETEMTDLDWRTIISNII